MPHTTQPSYDAAPYHPRSLIHIFTVTFCITFLVTFFTLLIVLSFLDPAFLFFLISSLAPFISTVTSSLAPVILFIIKTSAKLLALYLVYWLAEAIHFCYYMKKRQDERCRHQEQVFGHAKVWFVDEWYSLISEHRSDLLTDFSLESTISPTTEQTVEDTSSVSGSISPRLQHPFHYDCCLPT
jgi:hypothetical protein